MALEEIRNTKIKKVEELRKAGMDPYPASSGRTNTISEIIENFDKYAQEKNGLVLAGRVMAKREHGGSMFFDLRDASGKFQGFIKEDTYYDGKIVLGACDFPFVDLGDLVSCYLPGDVKVHIPKSSILVVKEEDAIAVIQRKVSENEKRLKKKRAIIEIPKTS